MIYMHRIETDPMREPIQKHLQELASIPWIDSSHLPLRLRVVVSYDKISGIVSDPTISKRVSSLCDQMKSLNSKTSKWLLSMHEVHFQGEPEVAWRAVEHLFRTDHDGPVCTPSNSTTYRWNQVLATSKHSPSPILLMICTAIRCAPTCYDTGQR